MKSFKNIVMEDTEFLSHIGIGELTTEYDNAIMKLTKEHMNTIALLQNNLIVMESSQVGIVTEDEDPNQQGFLKKAFNKIRDIIKAIYIAFLKYVSALIYRVKTKMGDIENIVDNWIDKAQYESYMMPDALSLLSPVNEAFQISDSDWKEAARHITINAKEAYFGIAADKQKNSRELLSNAFQMANKILSIPDDVLVSKFDKVKFDEIAKKMAKDDYYQKSVKILIYNLFPSYQSALNALKQKNGIDSEVTSLKAFVARVHSSFDSKLNERTANQKDSIAIAAAKIRTKIFGDNVRMCENYLNNYSRYILGYATLAAVCIRKVKSYKK